jgi:predicted phage terminase large subunit-like protein
MMGGMLSPIPPIETILKDPEKLRKLSDTQLSLFISTLKDAVRGLGRAPNLPVSPALFAERFSRNEWKPARHLQFLSDKLVLLKQRKLKRLMVSMPPRSGKSMLIDIYTPAWWLSDAPKDRIILAGYGEQFARSWGGKVRDLVIEYGSDLNLLLNKDHAAADDWELTAGGGMVCVGVGGALMGRGADLLIIDDPIKSSEEADSPTYRDKMWEWFQSTAITRLQPGGVVIAVMCLTGDTLVLLADGTEIPIRDIRPGARVATYKDGQITTATVQNWASQGLDSVLEIKTKSGTIRANAQHPFLVERNGVIAWKKTGTLEKGDHILRVTGGSGEARPALKKGATNPSTVGVFAEPTIRRIVGFVPAIAQRIPILFSVVRGVSSLATALPSKITRSAWLSRVGYALSAPNPHPARTQEPTGTGSSASTMIPEEFEGSSATTATSPWATEKHQKFSALLQTTYVVTADPVLFVEPAGVAEVFDIQVDPTGNFIANGLVSHNTRWSTDDLFARIQQNAPPGEWETVNLPALAEEGDALGRLPEEPLWPERFPDDPDYSKRKASMSPFWFSALYQGRPVPAGGGLIKEDWIRFYHTLPEEPERWIQSWDFSLKDTETSDYTVGQVWCRKGASLYLVAQFRGHANLATVGQKMQEFILNYPKAVGILIEDTAMGPIIKQTLQHIVRGLLPIKPRGSKRSRLEAVQPLFQGNNVYLPEKQDGTKDRWVWDFITELTSFPKGAFDDQVDACSQAIAFLTPGVWSSEKAAAEALQVLPEATPQQARTAWIEKFKGKVMKDADKRHRPMRSLVQSRGRTRGW